MMLRELLKSYGKTSRLGVRRVARKIGISHTALWRFQVGKEVTGRQMAAIIKWALE